MSEPLFDCPKCQRTNFSAKGLKAHRCTPQAASAEPEQALAPILPKPQLIGTFQSLQLGIKGDAMAMKIKMFFCGLLVNELYEVFRAEIGETRGGDQAAKGKTEAPSVLLENFLEDNLGVTSRTCRKYRNFWESCTASDKHQKAVKALNAVWTQHVESLKIEGPTSKKKAAKDGQPLALQEAGTLLAKDVQELLHEADELELHELFEIPVKDASIQADGEDAPEPADNKNKLIKFWITDFGRRLTRKEYLRLPKPQREALAADWEQSLHELKDSLNPAKKKGKV